MLFLALLGVNLLAWCWAVLAFHTSPALLGSALIAWGFGLRHAVDADHIAAIDNVTRRLMQDGQRPITVGLFFSLGHSTVVVVAGLVVVLAQGWFRSRFGLFAGWGAPAGAAVSAAFLLLIGASNLGVLLSLLRLRRRLRHGEVVTSMVLPTAQGGLSRLLAPLFRRVGTSRGMFWLGLLFGLGFDTATEIGVLALAAAGATHGQAGWAVMAFPALFTAGMTLVDTANGVMMLGAYGWALAEPTRKLGYNVAITAVSVVVALLIGLAEAVDLIRIPGFSAPAWTSLLDTHGELIGYGLVSSFALLWIGSMLGSVLGKRRRKLAAR
ncbi:MAG: HoxN/HupN/NixA family nickel/cobalt transporter [Janthinobacterium lividum]